MNSQRVLDVRPGRDHGDREFTLETVNCLGACALGPIVVVGRPYFSIEVRGGRRT